MKKALRNFLIITAVVFIAVLLLTHSQRTRQLVTPSGMHLPRGVDPGDR